MLTTILLLALLLGTSIGLDSNGSDCPSNWFGEKCMLMCHCNDSSCDSSGQCIQPSFCIEPYFGPSCQYVDVTMITGVEFNPPEINTMRFPCKNNSSLTTVSVSFPNPTPFSWLRVKASDSDLLLNFTVVINGDDVCHNERRFQLNDCEVDVACDSGLLLSKLELQGPVLPSLCSIRISAGRNVALKQETWQTSTMTPNENEVGESFMAVDGRVKTLISKNSCSTTQNEATGPSWYLLFKRPHILYSVFIVSRGDPTASFLHGFILETYDELTNITERYVDPNTFAPMYNVPLKSRQLVNSLRIFRPPLFGMSDLTLSLCEVLVYGETICQDGLYGLQCLNNCTCQETEMCNLVTGACAPGCDAGKYGFNCSADCSNLCNEGKCYNRFGACIHCIPGRTGKDCDKDCPEGTHGIDCQQRCSIHCLDFCNAENGGCTCSHNFQAPLCKDCAPGYYGENCTHLCPVNCEKHMCNKLTGNCVSCLGGRVGAHCEDCPHAYYGSLCYTKCSIYCLNGTCDRHNGTCPACTGGYTGPQCVLASRSESTWRFLLVLPVISLVVGMCTILLLRRKVSTLRNDAEKSRNSSGESSLDSAILPEDM